MQKTVDLRKSRLAKIAHSYRIRLGKNPQKEQEALAGAKDIFQAGLRKLQQSAQHNLNAHADQLSSQIQAAHADADYKHQQHIQEAFLRWQVREEYVACAMEEEATDIRTNKGRVDRHLHPQTINIDQQAVRPLHINPRATSPTRDHLVQVGPLWMPQEQADMVLQLRQSQLTPERRVVYSDGSVVRAGTADCAMAFGVVEMHTDTNTSIPGRTDGHASSGKAELMGLLATIVAMPPEQDILVRLDNKGVVTNFQDFVTFRSQTLPRKRLRVTHAGTWALLASLVEQRHGRTEVEWVRGHNGEEGNELADKVATDAVQQDTAPWQVDISDQHDITYVAQCHGQTLEMDLRQFLKQQTTIRHHQTWTAQKRVKRAISDLDDIEWRSALSIIHDKRPVHTFFSGRKDTTRRSQHIKKLHGMLPTLTVMQARHPELYEDATCCMCNNATEDNNHLWRCPSTIDTQRQIWEDAVEQIPKWGRAAINKANADAQNRYNKKQNRLPDTVASAPLQWRQPAEGTIWNALYSAFHDLHVLRPPGHDVAPLELARSVTTAYQGLLHSALINAWIPVFQCPRSVVVSVAHQFIRRLDREALSRIWKPRCEATIVWEKTKDIRPKMKRQTQPGTVWNNASGVILPPDTCDCGAALTAHIDDVCPGAQYSPTEADQRLLACIRGQVHLSTLEKMGKIHFL